MLDRITGMQVLARVAALGSLSGAARALGMSQTMATKHIAALESRLNVKLLHRSTRRVTLTDPGRRYLESAERILAELDEAETLASREGVEVSGTLRLNAPVSFGTRAIAPLLSDFSRLHPALSLHLGLTDRYVDPVEEGWDLLIRIGSLEASSMIARKLAPCPTAVCAAPAYLARAGTPRRIAELAGHNCLGYTLSRRIGTRRWDFGGPGRASVAVSGSIECNNGDALVTAAAGGLGIVYQPMFLVADEIASGRLVALDLDCPTLDFGGVYAVYPADRRPPAKVRAAIDFFSARLGG